ncbi:MAG TPA: SRPBCC family protein [Thermoplasmata archaeon]|nr:SRPBCC family protein [Thermoplasmata archaeon]
MISSKRRASVACRIDSAFDYVADWKNIKDFMPMLLNVEPTSLVQYGPGASFDVTIVLGRLEMKTSLDVTEFVKNSKVTLKTTKGIRLRVAWEFKDIGDNVLITFSFDYDFPSGFTVRQDPKEALEKELEDAASRSMDLLKWVLESSCDKNDAH